MKFLSLLLVFAHALRCKFPDGISRVVAIDPQKLLVVASAVRCCKGGYIKLKPGTRRRQVDEAIRQLCQEIDAHYRLAHGESDPDAIDLGPIEFRVPASRRIDCSGGDA